MSLDKNKLDVMGTNIADFFRAIKEKYNRKRPSAYNAETADTVGGRDSAAFDAELVAPINNHINAVGDPHKVTAAQVGVYSKGEFDDLIRSYFLGSGFPITRIGSLSYHPIPISGDSRGLDIMKSSGLDRSRYYEHPLACIEDDESIVYLRNCSNGFERGVYYVYAPNGTYSDKDLVTTNSQYKLPDNSNIAYIYQGSQGCFAGKCTTATGITDGQPCFIALHYNNLNNIYHYFVRVSQEFESILKTAEIVATSTTVYIISVMNTDNWVKQDHGPRIQYWKIPRNEFTQKGPLVKPQLITVDYQNGFGGRIADAGRDYYQLANRMVTYDPNDKQGIVSLTDGLMKGGAALLPERIRTYTMYSPDEKFLRTLLVYQFEVTGPNDVTFRREVQINFTYETTTNNITLSSNSASLPIYLKNGAISQGAGLTAIDPTTQPSLVGDEKKACGVYLSESDGYLHYTNSRQIGTPEKITYFSPPKVSFYEALEAPLILTELPNKELNAKYRAEGFLGSSPLGLFVFGKERYMSGLVSSEDEYIYYDIKQNFGKTYAKTDAEGTIGEAYALPDTTKRMDGSGYGDEDTLLCISSVHKNGNFTLNSLYFFKGKHHAMGYAYLNEGLYPISDTTLISRRYGDVTDTVAQELKYTDWTTYHELVITGEDELPGYFLMMFTSPDGTKSHARVYEADLTGKPSKKAGVSGESVSFNGLGKLVVDLPDIRHPNSNSTTFTTDLKSYVFGKFSADYMDGGWVVQWLTRYVGQDTRGRNLLGFGMRFWVESGTAKVESAAVDVIDYSSGLPRLPAIIPTQGAGYVTTAGNRTIQCVEIIARNRKEFAVWSGIKSRRFLLPQHNGDRWTFYLVEPIPVVMTGFSFEIPAAQYSLTSMYDDPSDKLLFIYVVIKNHQASLEFSEVELDETSDRTFVGTILTDGRGIEKIDIQKVTRLENFRLSTEPVGSAMSVTTGVTSVEDREKIKIRWT